MGSCNVAQKEIGGKHILIKKCIELLYNAVDTEDEITTTTAHGAAVGDVVKFQERGTITSVNLTSLYSITEIVSSTKFKIAPAPGGTEIVFNNTESGLKLDLFKNVSGARSKSMEFSVDGIDITNQDSDEWSKMLDEAGIRSFTFSADGVYNNGEVFVAMRTEALENKLQCLMVLDTKTAEAVYGCFKVTSLSVEGGHDAEASYSMSASSSGEITVFKFP